MLDWLLTIAGAALALTGLAVAAWALRGDRPHGRRRCPKCWYDMTALASLTCPECGRTAASERALARTRRRWGVAFGGIVLVSLGAATVQLPSIMRHGWHSLPSPVLRQLLACFDGDAARAFDSHVVGNGASPLTPISQWDRLLVARRCAVLLAGEHLLHAGHSEQSQRLLVDQALRALVPRERVIVAPVLERGISDRHLSAPTRTRYLRLAEAMTARAVHARLVEFCLTDPDDMLRREAIAQAPRSDLAPAKAVLLLTSIIENHASYSMRAAAIDALAAYREEVESITVLLRHLAEHDESTAVRGTALYALKQPARSRRNHAPATDETRPQWPTSPFRDSLGGKLARNYRFLFPVQERLQEVNRIGLGPPPSPRVRETGLEVLVEMLRDPVVEVKVAAAKAIGNWGPAAADALPFLKHVMQHDADAEARSAAAAAAKAVETGVTPVP